MKLFTSLVLVVAATSSALAEQTYRMHDGATAFVVNPDGKPFSVSLDVRDINIFETGPREVLVKIYDPDGRTILRKVIPDDGVTRKPVNRFEVMNQGMHWIDFVILALYASTMIALGWYYGRQQNSTDEFLRIIGLLSSRSGSLASR